MSVVDINAIRLDNFFKLVDETLASSFDTQHIVYFIHVVGVGFDGVDVRIGEASF